MKGNIGLINKSREYYKNNKEWLDPFIDEVFKNEGVPSNSKLIILRSSKSNFFGYLRNNGTITIEVANIIYSAMQFPEYIQEDIIKFNILYTIIHEKYHEIQFKPMRCIGRMSLDRDKRFYDYFELPAHKMTYIYIMNNFDRLSLVYNIDKEILYNLTVRRSYISFLKNKKFKRCSEYNIFKVLYHDFVDLNDLEKECMGKNYYSSSIFFEYGSKSIMVKNGSYWNMKGLYKYSNKNNIIIKYKRGNK